MIIRGCDRNVKDNQGNTPLQLVRYNEVLIKLLGKPEMNKPGCQLTTPVIYLKKSWNIFAINFSLMLSTFILLHLFVFPYEEYFDHVFHVNVFFVTANVFFFLASFRDPGFMKKRDTEVKFYNLVEKMGAGGSLCPYCETVVTQDTSRHCDVCHRCTHGFDHHCQWINNCVGEKNHFLFFMYVTVLEIYFITVLIALSFNFNTELTRQGLEKT